MSTNTSAREAFEAIGQRYQFFFAGQPRITRDPSMLDAMVRDLDALRPGGDAELKGQIAETRALYQKEARAVREAQAQGPEALFAHRLSTWAFLTFMRYRHHFAGQNRGTRDLGLLSEMIADLEQLHGQIAAQKKRFSNEELETAQESLQQQLQMYRDERRLIAEARTDGDLSEQADRLAALANAQFKIYADQFAGKSRLSRRPMLLERMIDSLRQVGERMQALVTQGHKNETNRKNIEIVAERLAAYRKELEAIQQARSTTDFSALIGALGGAANEVFAQYGEHFAGKDRATRDLARLTAMLDSLFDIGRQMDDLEQVRHDDVNARNLQIVLDTFRMYDQEHQKIAELKAGAPSSGGDALPS